MDYESHAVALDRNELGALLVAARLSPPTEHALISLLALNGPLAAGIPPCALAAVDDLTVIMTASTAHLS